MLYKNKLLTSSRIGKNLGSFPSLTYGEFPYNLQMSLTIIKVAYIEELGSATVENLEDGDNVQNWKQFGAL